MSARIPKFAWQPNEVFSGEIWLLNDSYKKVSDAVDVYLIIDNEKHLLTTWQFEGQDSSYP